MKAFILSYRMTLWSVSLRDFSLLLNIWSGLMHHLSKILILFFQAKSFILIRYDSSLTENNAFLRLGICVHDLAEMSFPEFSSGLWSS